MKVPCRLLLALAFGSSPVLVPALVRAAPASPEAAPVAALDQALLDAMKAGSANASFQSRYDALRPVIAKVLNMPTILQGSVGFLWSTLPAAQQQELATLFEQFTVASYVNGFSSFSGQQIQLLDEKTLGAKKIVNTQIVPSDGSDPTPLDYVMAEGPGGWQATDVLLNGTISKVAIQSSDFSSLVTSGDASQLISALKAKIGILSDGALKA